MCVICVVVLAFLIMLILTNAIVFSFFFHHYAFKNTEKLPHFYTRVQLCNCSMLYSLHELFCWALNELLSK